MLYFRIVKKNFSPDFTTYQHKTKVYKQIKTKQTKSNKSTNNNTKRNKKLRMIKRKIGVTC